MKIKHLIVIITFFIFASCCKTKPKVTVGKEIEVDFDGNGEIELAQLKMIKEFEDGSGKFIVLFSDTTFTKLNPRMIG